MTKYSSSFWGTSFINEMGRISAAGSATSNVTPSTAETTSSKSELKMSKDSAGSGLMTAVGSTNNLLQVPTQAVA